MNFYERCQKAVADNFREFLLAWLADLPADGWQGSAGELEVLWYRRAVDMPQHKQPIVPSPKGISQWLKAEGLAIAAAGWEVTFRRTATARTIHITRRPADPPAQI